MLWGRADWPGAAGCTACEYTCSHGTAPGVATFTMPIPQRGPVGQGTLRMLDGSGVVRLPGCKLDRLSVNYGGTAPTLTLYILDRRWRWAFGAISGTYNVRDAEYEIDPVHRRSVRQLATACLLAMGERTFSVEGLPHDVYPAVDWVDANPAQELESLAAAFDCRVVYRPSSDSVLVARRGVGIVPPANRPIAQSTPELDFPETPDAIVLSGGPVRTEAMFMLEAVGLDLDGQIKTLDALSYRPSRIFGKHDWAYSPPPNFSNLLDGDTTHADYERALGLAQQTVFRWYRVNMAYEADRNVGPPTIPGFGRVIRREQLLLEPTRMLTVTRPDGSLAERPAEVSGIFDRRKQIGFATSIGSFGNSANITRVNSGFSIDSERGLVIFDEPMFKQVGGTGEIEAADLRLLCAVQVRDVLTNSLHRYRAGVASSSPIGSGAAVVHVPELSLSVIGQYVLTNGNLPEESPKWKLVDVSTNRAELDRLAAAYIAAAGNHYKRGKALEIVYPGIVPIAPDGAIQQITWRLGVDGPPTTSVSQNTEHAYWLPTFEQRRRRPQPAVMGERNAPSEISQRTLRAAAGAASEAIRVA